MKWWSSRVSCRVVYLPVGIEQDYKLLCVLALAQFFSSGYFKHMDQRGKSSELMGVLDYVLNRCTLREIDALEAAVERRRRDLTSQSGIISLDPGRAAKEMTGAVNKSINASMDGIRETFRHFAEDVIHKEAPRADGRADERSGRFLDTAEHEFGLRRSDFQLAKSLGDELFELSGIDAKGSRERRSPGCDVRDGYAIRGLQCWFDADFGRGFASGRDRRLDDDVLEKISASPSVSHSAVSLRGDQRGRIRLQASNFASVGE